MGILPGGLDAHAGGSSFVIPVVGGIGVGRTLLSSFDAALKQCGVYNYNLVTLSSIIPPGSLVVALDRYESPPDEYGHRLYVVKAECRSALRREGVAAGIGWHQWGDGRGVFVEHEASASSEGEARREVERSIRESLRDLCAFRDLPFDEHKIGSRVVTAEVEDEPVSVVVAAVFRAEGWF